MADLCQLLQIKHLQTSVYHLQTDGLVERFTHTMKRMLLQWVVNEEGRYWDLLLSYILFSMWESLQASIRFTSFKLL